MSILANPRSNLVNLLLPQCVVVVEGTIEDTADDLWPEEALAVQNAVAKRKREFACGRRFARRCLGALGMPPGALPANADRSPRWPDGFVGSITHTDTYCAVAVARKTDIRAIGIDIENPSRFKAELWPHVLSPQEIRDLERLEPRLRQRVAALEFSAKEAFYKCIHDMAPGTPPFSDSVVELDETCGRFTVRLLTTAGPFEAGQVFTGRYASDGNKVATAIGLPP